MDYREIDCHQGRANRVGESAVADRRGHGKIEGGGRYRKVPCVDTKKWPVWSTDTPVGTYLRRRRPGLQTLFLPVRPPIDHLSR